MGPEEWVDECWGITLNASIPKLWKYPEFFLVWLVSCPSLGFLDSHKVLACSGFRTPWISVKLRDRSDPGKVSKDDSHSEFLVVFCLILYNSFKLDIQSCTLRRNVSWMLSIICGHYTLISHSDSSLPPALWLPSSFYQSCTISILFSGDYGVLGLTINTINEAIFLAEFPKINLPVVCEILCMEFLYHFDFRKVVFLPICIFRFIIKHIYTAYSGIFMLPLIVYSG